MELLECWSLCQVIFDNHYKDLSWMKTIEKGDKIVVIGGGGHALSLVEAIPATGFAGYLALAPSEKMELPWLGTDDELPHLAGEGTQFHVAFIYSGLPVMDKRRELIENYRNKGARFVTLVAPTAIVTPHTRLGEGCCVLNGAIVNRAVLGENVVINSGAIVEHDCVLGDNTFVGPGAVIGGGVTIGRDCFIGLGARIKNGITIADGVTVAMGAIVTRDLKEPGLYHGSPLRCCKIQAIHNA